MSSADFTPFEPIVMGQCHAAVRPGICVFIITVSFQRNELHPII